jgi:flagellar protein FlbB
MGEKRMTFFLILIIGFLSFAVIYLLDSLGIIRGGDYITMLKDENPPILEDTEFPGEVEKLRFQKWEERLMQREEEIASREAILDGRFLEVQQKEQEINEIKAGVMAERKKLAMMAQDIEDRNTKVEDLANKVGNMPPEKAVEMMVNWRDFDIIDVLRQMDRNAIATGAPSITPFLLTLFTPERRAEIARKMLLPKLEQTGGLPEPGAL